MADSGAKTITGVRPAPAAPFRPVRLGPNEALVERRADGAILVRSPYTLPEYPLRLTDRLDYWAATTPDAIFIAEREAGGAWRSLTYAETRREARAVAAALVGRNLSADRPVAILSGNDIEHALLGFACMYAGIPYAPISPAYSIVSQDLAKLRHVIGKLTPGLVFAADGAHYGRAIEAVLPADATLVVTRNPPARRGTILFHEFRGTPGAALDAAHADVGPDTVAKLLFTSGSTGLPKGVINTHRMLSSNQMMIRESLAFLKDEPPVILDWLPWNHTFGGNHDIGLVLFNGGSFYIDAGKPTPDGIGETVRNLRDIAPTIYFNVPKGFESLIPHLDADRALAEKFFSRLKLNFYAAAGLPQHIWDALDDLAVRTTGERIVMLSGLGATETSPFAFVVSPDNSRSGYVGLPCAGLDVKLTPVDDKLEARLKGPNVTPGYWREPELTRLAFDEEGWYRLGDALKFVDERDPQKGLLFDGRINEDFKLSSGTWVSVGPLRQKFIAHFAPYVREVVLAGANRDEIGALIFLDPDARQTVALRAEIARRLTSLAREAKGSSTRITRAIVLEEPPSVDGGEITDKGSINQKAVLARRAALVDALYADPPPANVITATESVLCA